MKEITSRLRRRSFLDGSWEWESKGTLQAKEDSAQGWGRMEEQAMLLGPKMNSSLLKVERRVWWARGQSSPLAVVRGSLASPGWTYAMNFSLTSKKNLGRRHFKQ